ncbi:craniofacial development protein 1 isoform X1 [Falco biarmicus]|uniref:craniofacial development protein 1 isoform X1 n=2 Tax=Falco cherrug TaxID=345164 RepID=UPI0024785A04|nr:craniofacial development protein 1 isoform X1 [Falco cherrug]XP_056216615.1 craniofacial development protein 1 isoform X1 [Falco biarmicus]
MSGSEEYSSAEDEDYVPSGAEYSEDDVSELVREEAADSPRPPRGRRSPRRPASRKRKKGGLLLEPDEKEEEKAQRNEEEEEEEVDSVEQVERNREEEEKKKEDALWASFLSDVGQKPKAGAATHVTQTKKAEEEKSGNKLQEKPKDSVKVTITKTFDFAGEEVRVTKEVDSNSKEAKSFLKQQEKWQSASPASLPTVSGRAGWEVGSTAVQGVLSCLRGTGTLWSALIPSCSTTCRAHMPGATRTLGCLYACLIEKRLPLPLLLSSCRCLSLCLRMQSGLFVTFTGLTKGKLQSRITVSDSSFLLIHGDECQDGCQLSG